MAEVCVEDKQNLGVDKCGKAPQLLRTVLEAPRGFKFTAAQLADADLLRTAIEDLLYAPKASRGYLWPFAGDVVNNSEAENIYQETALMDVKVRKGKYRWRFFFPVSLCLHAAMFSHDGANSNSFYLYDVEQGLYGMLVGGELYPYNAALNNMENLRISDGSVATMSPLYVVLANSDDLNKLGGRANGSALEIVQPLTDVIVTVVGTPTATTIVVDIKVACNSIPVNGFVMADFVKTGAGAISGVTEVNGRYTITGTGFATGTIDLDTPDDLSIKGWESLAPAVVTI